MDRVRVVAQSEDVLGEGPCWDARSGRLYWFDIKSRRLNWISERAEGVYSFPVRPSVLTPTRSGGLLLVAEDGLSAFSAHTGRHRLIEPAPPMPDGFRSNDGKIDVHGRLWWSVMDDDGGKRPGFLYRRAPGGTSVQAATGIHIANTCCCSPDGRTFYLADSARQAIYAYDLDPFSGVLSGRRVFASTKGGPGSPDGSAVDLEGYLWNAEWGGSRVVRYAPDGRIDRVVEIPALQPSSCCFGGEDLKTLYVTSAAEGLENPGLSGSLFAFEPGVAGLALPLFDDLAEPEGPFAG